MSHSDFKKVVTICGLTNAAKIAKKHNVPLFICMHWLKSA